MLNRSAVILGTGHFCRGGGELGGWTGGALSLLMLSRAQQLERNIG